MSAYMKLLTPMTDEESLLLALADLGFDRSKVEVHANAVPLVGYQDDRREQTANVIIRRKHVGSASNDMGFLDSATGYQALISDYDRSHYGTNWLAELNQHYGTHFSAKQERMAAEERARLELERQRLVEAQRSAIHERAKKAGYQVKEARDGDVIRLVLVKRVY
jgi:hypothetical protein